MFRYLIEIDAKLYERYLTVEKNIKSASNSFYDSYLDLQEQFVKRILIEQSYEIKLQETCGAILKKREVKKYFQETLTVDEFSYNKMQDYTLKVNEHKHKGEKKIQIDTIVNYMRVFYNVSIAYARFLGIVVDDFDANYFVEIFGLYEKENLSLKTEVSKLKNELLVSIEAGKLKDSDIEAFSNIISQSEIDKIDMEEQNKELQRQISKLKDIILSSMEEKLNKTINLLNQLTESVVENRAISYAVGDTICGADRFKTYVAKAKEELKK